jgi:xylulokinase
MSYVIGLDIGTTGCKSILFDQEGQIVSESYIEYSLMVISDREIEQNPHDWWNLSIEVILDVLNKSCIQRQELKAICISSQGISFVPVDQNCNPLSNAISWLDTRSEEQTVKIINEIGEDRIYEITGKRINSAYVLPKILWIRQNNPSLYDKTYKFLMAHDYILARLSGEFATDHTMAGGTLLYDVNELRWSRTIIDIFKIDLNKLPEIKWSGEVVGKIKKDVAKALGLANEVLICVGAQDQKAAAVGARINYGEATISLGTAGAIEIKTDKPVFDKHKRIPCFTYVEKDTWVLEAVIATSGAALKWFRNTLFPELSYKELDDLCEKSPVGSNGLFFYPHLSGATSPYWNNRARGVFYGLSMNTTREDVVRAVLEGLAFQLKSNLLIAEEMGALAHIIKIFGGGSKSRIWKEIISNITGKNLISFDSPEIANLGAGVLAAKGCGLYHENFGKQILERNTRFYFNEQITAQYEEMYKKYLRIEKNLIYA